MSKIEWTDQTWNPTTGCNKISQGCKFCYAEVMHKRLMAMGQPKYTQPFSAGVVCHETELKKPLSWKKPSMIFVNSMSDLFHKDVPLDFIQQVFQVIEWCPQHIFQVLTKRSQRLLELSPKLDWPNNLWMGVSVEDEKNMFRIDHLKSTAAKIKFLSCEPLIGPLTGVNMRGIDWVIVGGESGHKPRPMNEKWVTDILQHCQKNNIPFFFKQWGGKNKKKTGRTLNGKTYDGMPHQYTAKT